MKLKRKIMIDTNVLIYFLTDINIEEKDKIKRLFEKENKFQFVITTRILDELIFKLIVLNSGTKLKKLKQNKKLLKQSTKIIDTVKDFLKDFNFRIYEIKENHYWKLKQTIEKYGLIGNDALTFIIMKENNLKYIATLDKDFSNLPIENILEKI